MDESRFVLDYKSEDSGSATSGVSVYVLNRIVDVLVKIELEFPLKDFRWEGRGDRLLLFWKESKVIKIQSGLEFRFDYLTSSVARAVTLPCDVDASRITLAISGMQLVLGLPKTALAALQDNVGSTTPIGAL